MPRRTIFDDYRQQRINYIETTTLLRKIEARLACITHSLKRGVLLLDTDGAKKAPLKLCRLVRELLFLRGAVPTMREEKRLQGESLKECCEKIRSDSRLLSKAPAAELYFIISTN